jgi:predicted transposase YbfD/YdcC
MHPEEAMRGLVNKIKNIFVGMKDPRKQCGALEHNFNGVLCLAATAMVFGANGPTAVEEFGKNMRGHVLRAAGLLKVPSHDTIGRVLDMVDPMDMDRAVQVGREIEDARRERVEKVKRPRFRHVSVDGKMMCGSGSSVNDHAAVGVVNAWDVGSGRNVATVPYPGRGQEVAAARTLLARLGESLEGVLVSMDALHCCKETLALVGSLKAAWLVPVKGNCPALRAELVSNFPSAPPPGAVSTVEKAHGRIETRIGEVVANADVMAWIADLFGCGGLAMLGRVTYRTEQRGKAPTEEVCHFFCSRKMTAPEFLKVVREHWAVESTLHNRLDVTLGEDRCRVRSACGAANLAVLRRHAVGVLDGFAKSGESLRATICRVTWAFAGRAALEAAV